MNGKLRKSWMVAGMLTMGVCAAMPAFTEAREETRSVRYETLPREVLRTLDEERAGRRVLAVQFVVQDGKEFYRCTVALKRGERNIRIQPGGNLLSVEDVREVDVPAFHKAGDDWYHEREQRDVAREEYWKRLDERVRATARDPERVAWDELPPRVQAVFIRVSYGAKVDYIVRYRDGGRVIYQTNIPDGPGRRHMVQATWDGVIVSEAAFTDNGRPIEGDFKARIVEWEDLPRSVKFALDHDYHGARVSHIDFSTHRGQRLYNVTIDEPRHDRFLVIDEDGDVLSNIVGRDF